MSKLRSINTKIWSDVWFELLNPEQKLLFIYLVSNEKTNMLGVYEISIRKVSFETGIDSSKIKKYLLKFENDSKIRYACDRVLLLNFLKHQNYNFNMMKSAIRTFNELPKELRGSLLDDIEETKEGFKTLCNGFLGVRKVEVEDEIEEESKIEDEIGDKPPVFSFKQSFLDLGVEESILTDWIKVRKTKRATNSETAFNGIKKQIEESGKTANECIKISVENSWSGFKVEWINKFVKPQKQTSMPVSDFKTITEADKIF